METLLDSILENNKRWTKEGKVATYIPMLGEVDPDLFGIAMMDMEGNIYAKGDYQHKYTLQSITKVITLMVALMDRGPEKVFEFVGMEPTGDPFNSIIKLETIQPSKPLNPMINAGAIVTASLVRGEDPEERFQRILSLVHKMTDNPSITYNHQVYLSESNTGNLNRALAYFMKNHGVLQGDIENHLEVYFKQSSIEVTSLDVAKIGAIIANDGKSIVTGEEIVPASIIRIVKTFMITCGMYNASGEFAIKVGIPAKSGVGGGILASVPNRYGIGVIGPALDDKGNSYAGVKLLEDLSSALKLSIF